MISQNIREKIIFYLNANPNLSHEKIGILLNIDNIYNEIPTDIKLFRNRYIHLDPSIVNNPQWEIKFLKIQQKNISFPGTLKKNLNDYLNIKYNSFGKKKNYKENMVKFARHSQIVSSILKDVLTRAKLSSELKNILEETSEITNCHDFYDILVLFKKSNSPRIKFEILRKLWLILLLARIDRCFFIDNLNLILKEIRIIIMKGFSLKTKENKEKTCYFWLDEKDLVQRGYNYPKCLKEYQTIVQLREKLILPIYPLQNFKHFNYKTKKKNHILHLELRNKLVKNNHEYYTSIVEKIIRKNLEFPSRVNDVLALRIVVDLEKNIPKLIEEIEEFWWGSSARKKEKNSLHLFWKRKLSNYSSENYYVWKAVYDVALSNPLSSKIADLINKLNSSSKENESILSQLETLFNYYQDKPQDQVIEVQIQDLSSYLQSMAIGSSSNHEILKMNQVRFNSFYKFFPKEIYQQEIKDLRNKILKV